MILENLRAAAVRQAHREDRISFVELEPWPGGRLIAAAGSFMEGAVQRRAGIFIGPEFGTVSRPDLVAAAREAGEAGFDVLIACAFSYDAHSAESGKPGRVPVRKARMNPDLHMGDRLAASGAGNLFVIFGEPDIAIEEAGEGLIRMRIKGVDLFKPQTGEVASEGPEGIALWMIDSDHTGESFFLRHAYFPGADDPCKALKTTLRAEIDAEAWESLHSDVSRPFPKPASGRIAVKVVNHLGEEVMKVFKVGEGMDDPLWPERGVAAGAARGPMHADGLHHLRLGPGWESFARAARAAGVNGLATVSTGSAGNGPRWSSGSRRPACRTSGAGDVDALEALVSVRGCGAGRSLPRARRPLRRCGPRADARASRREGA